MSKLEIGTPLNTIKEELLTFATLLRAKGNQQFMTERTRKETIFKFAQRCKDWAGKLSDIDFQVGVNESDVIIYGVKATPIFKLQIGESLLITNTGDEIKLGHIIHEEDDALIGQLNIGDVQEVEDGSDLQHTPAPEDVGGEFVSAVDSGAEVGGKFSVDGTIFESEMISYRNPVTGGLTSPPTLQELGIYNTLTGRTDSSKPTYTAGDYEQQANRADPKARSTSMSPALGAPYGTAHRVYAEATCQYCGEKFESETVYENGLTKYQDHLIAEYKARFPTKSNDEDPDSMESENLRSESTDDRVTGRGHF